MSELEELIEQLYKEKDLPDCDLKRLIENDESGAELRIKADIIRREHYSTDVYIRGLIEISNYCQNNCYYCGIRRDNKNLERYRLGKEEILDCCREGYDLGFRTFVLQGGEDNYFTDDKICDIVSEIKKSYLDTAVTLSIGEKSYESYKTYFDAGADRYLLRHETADEEHYRMLHPEEMSVKARKQCLFDLKNIGYQVGTGFMVGSPYQTTKHIIEDIRFLQKLKPDMIGIGPFITHKDTMFYKNNISNLSPQNDVLYQFNMCLKLISILRIMFPYALIPATTALGTINEDGRERGLESGANVIMPNLSPVRCRNLYNIYDNKICTGAESAEHLLLLKQRVNAIGYNIVTHIGHVNKQLS